ncbi:hypothetical protein AB0G76_36845 [Streptomyces asoensis]|uniref:hypothetical protein n=1 Tax=Streptomyces asoensis TaxID=249586 RepID=UPI0033CE10FD
MTGPRYTADSITDDALDELYANASKGWRRGDIWKAKAVEIEADRDRLLATIARLTAWCDELDALAQGLSKDQDSGIVHPVAANIRAKLAEPKEQSNT